MVYVRDVNRNLLNAIMSSVDSNLFRHLYVIDEDGKEIDVLEDGALSCAYYVTSLLMLAGRMDRPHATVTTTLTKFEEADQWHRTEEPAPGDVVYWGPGTHGHTHVGLFVSNSEAVSTSASLGVPIRHPLRMDDGREPIAYWHYDEHEAA